jgi:hypothetical protein
MTLGMTRSARFLAWTLAAAFAVASFAFGQGTVTSYSPLTASDLEAPADGDWLMWRRTTPPGVTARSTRSRPRTSASSASRGPGTWSTARSRRRRWSTTGSCTCTTRVTASRPRRRHGRPHLGVHDRTSRATCPASRASILRSMALAHDKLYFASGDMQLVALDPRTGQVIWESSIGAWEERFRPTGGPLVVGDVVVVRLGLRRRPARGLLHRGPRRHTGEAAVARQHDRRGGHAEGDTWNNLPWESRFGSSAWNIGSYDPELDLVYSDRSALPVDRRDERPLAGEGGREQRRPLHRHHLAMRPGRARSSGTTSGSPTTRGTSTTPTSRPSSTSRSTARPSRRWWRSASSASSRRSTAATAEWLWAIETVYQNVVASIDPVTGEKTINMETWPAIGQTTVNCPADPGWSLLGRHGVQPAHRGALPAHAGVLLRHHAEPSRRG